MPKDHLKKERDTKIDSAFLDLTRQLSVVDFSKSSHKETVYRKTLKNLNEYEGVKDMKIMEKVKKVGLAVAAIALVTTLSMQTTFAQELVEKIIMQISLGHVTATQYEDNRVKDLTVPSYMKGKIFDKDGKPIEQFTEETKEIYTEDGDKILGVKTDGVGNDTIFVTENSEAENVMIIKDLKRLNDYTCFKVILPSYLPEGYVFDRAEFYKDEKGIVKDTKYISIYFTNLATEKSIYMQQRFADEETAYEMSAGKMEKIKINGVDAILDSNNTLNWEAYGNIYYISLMKTYGEVSKEELIKIAESVK